MYHLLYSFKRWFSMYIRGGFEIAVGKNHVLALQEIGWFDTYMMINGDALPRYLKMVLFHSISQQIAETPAQISETPVQNSETPIRASITWSESDSFASEFRSFASDSFAPEFRLFRRSFGYLQRRSCTSNTLLSVTAANVISNQH